jgi:hypothetical protein
MRASPNQASIPWEPPRRILQIKIGLGMSQGEEAILFSNREVVAGVILMVVSIDNDIRMKGI